MCPRWDDIWWSKYLNFLKHQSQKYCTKNSHLFERKIPAYDSTQRTSLYDHDSTMKIRNIMFPLINPQTTVRSHQWVSSRSLLQKDAAGNPTMHSIVLFFFFLSVWSSSSVLDFHDFSTIEDYKPVIWGHILQLGYDISGSSATGRLPPSKAAFHRENMMSACFVSSDARSHSDICQPLHHKVTFTK